MDSFKILYPDSPRGLKHAWDSVQRVWKARQDGYPYSIKEIFDPITGMMCHSLREEVRNLIKEEPSIRAAYIVKLLTYPAYSVYGLGGKSPFQAVLSSKDFTVLSQASMAVRSEIDDLNQLLERISYGLKPEGLTNRSFFAPELRK